MLRLLILQDGTSSSGVNVETFGGVISTSGGKVDTGGGEVTTGKITTTGDISIGGKMNVGSGGNIITTDVSASTSKVLYAKSSSSSGSAIFGENRFGPGIQGEGNPGLKTTEL